MNCEWGRTDCLNVNSKCHLCVTRDFHYEPTKTKKPKPMSRRQQKADRRMGGHFEFKNHQSNEALLSGGAVSSMTPNSGAGRIKGDEQISGIIEVMEELKTKVVEQAKGKASFTIKKEWLDKLHREAKQEEKEFWYLKFAFNQYDEDVYIIVENDMIMSMIKTMVDDRKKALHAESRIDLAEKMRRLKEAENIKLQAEIDLLNAKIKLLEERGD